MRRVDFDAVDLSGAAELDDGPVVAWATSPFCFPTVAHVCCAAGHDQVMTVTEEHVATGEYERAVLSRREINLSASAFELVPVGDYFAVHAKSRDTAVRIDLETKVRDAFVVVDWERVLAVAGERHLREEWYPLDVFARQLLIGGKAGECGAFERAVFGVVAAKVGGVDDDAADDSREAETNDAPIEPGVRRRRLSKAQKAQLIS